MEDDNVEVYLIKAHEVKDSLEEDEILEALNNEIGYQTEEESF